MGKTIHTESWQGNLLESSHLEGWNSLGSCWGRICY